MRARIPRHFLILILTRRSARPSPEGSLRERDSPLPGAQQVNSYDSFYALDRSIHLIYSFIRLYG